MKGISANNKHSFNDFGLCIANRKITPPAIKRITETVPYMHGEYDFSSIDGEVALENGKLYYEFDIAELTIELMERVKNTFLDWIYSINDNDIFDDYLEDYYFHGSLVGVDWEEDFGKGILGITFSVYPYMYEREEKVINFVVDKELTKIITTKSSHNIVPSITTDANLTIEIDQKQYSLSPGTYQYDDFLLKSGDNNVKFIGNANVTISFRNEVIY